MIAVNTFVERNLGILLNLFQDSASAAHTRQKLVEAPSAETALTSRFDIRFSI